MQQGFSQKLLGFENMIASASGGDWFALRQFLGFEREYAHLGHLQPPLSKGEDRISLLSSKNKTALSNLLLAYRTVDIAATLKSHPELPVRYEKSSDFGKSLQVEFFPFRNSAPSQCFAGFRTA
jgi:hypothetical protein